MLRWLHGDRRAGGAEPLLLTDDPLATIAGRGHHRRLPQPVYSVTRVNPLYREGPTASYDEPGDGSSIEYSRPYSPTRHPPGSLEYALPVSADGSASGGDLDTERVSVTSVGPAQRPPRTPPPPPAPPPAPPPRRAVHLRGGHAWAGLDVLRVDSEYVSGMAVNLARLRPKTGEERRMLTARQRSVRKAAVRRRPPARATLVTNPEFVKGVLVTTITAQPAECPKMEIKTNSEYVVLVATRCRHTMSVAAEVVTRVCPKIRLEMNPDFVRRISSNCRHVKIPPSPRDWPKILPFPSFHIGAPSQASSRHVAAPFHGLPSSTPPLETAPDSIVTDSLLMLTSPDLSLAATLRARPMTSALPAGDQLMPDHVLAQFSQVIANSRSVSMVRRAGSDARSSAGSSAAGSVASQASRGSGRPDPAMAVAPVAFVTSLWERTGLRTNGRKLLVNEDGEEEGWSGSGSGRTSGGRTPSPPVPPRLPLSQSWLQRLSELPGLRPTPTVRAADPPDPAALTAVVVEPALASAPPRSPDPASVSSSGRHVKFAGTSSRLGPPLDAPASDQQRLWNSFYGAGASIGYGALQPPPYHLQAVKHPAGLHDRKVSEFTLDARGASALRERAEERRRSRRLWRVAFVVLVLGALAGSIILVSWYCTKGRHLFGAL